MVFLALAVLLSALTAGHARGQARVAGQIVICSGASIVVISVDADGQPVKQTLRCPDCVLKTAVPLIAPPEVTVPLRQLVLDAPAATSLGPPSPSLVEDRARAPPRSV